MKTTIKIRDFAYSLGGKKIEDGPNSGERFRNDVLIPAIKEYGEENIIIDLNGTGGYASNWLEEAFVGLKGLEIVGEESLVMEIRYYQINKI